MYPFNIINAYWTEQTWRHDIHDTRYCRLNSYLLISKALRYGPCVTRGSYSFTCHPHMNHTCLCSLCCKTSPLFGLLLARPSAVIIQIHDCSYERQVVLGFPRPLLINNEHDIMHCDCSALTDNSLLTVQTDRRTDEQTHRLNLYCTDTGTRQIWNPFLLIIHYAVFFVWRIVSNYLLDSCGREGC